MFNESEYFHSNNRKWIFKICSNNFHFTISLEALNIKLFTKSLSKILLQNFDAHIYKYILHCQHIQDIL